MPPHLVVRGTTASDEPADEPLWRQMWEARWPRIAILILALAALTTTLFVQDFVAQRRDFWWYSRLGAAAFTLIWLGWYTGAQLSVVNVLTFANSLLSKFEWEFFLREPLIFILWGYVAVALLFWGRGVFCGWLCPFGALQEFASLAAKKLRIADLPAEFVLDDRNSLGAGAPTISSAKNVRIEARVSKSGTATPCPAARIEHCGYWSQAARDSSDRRCVPGWSTTHMR